MALQISEKKGIIYVDGKIKTETVQSFVSYLKHMLVNNTKVIVNIDKATAIDVDGLNALKTLDKMATILHKSFAIIGYGSREIYEDFESRKLQVV